MSETTRLAISGVRPRVALRVASRRDHRVTLEQKLPFLAIGTEVSDENGQTGRIERVGVALEGGVPKLVLELAYDVLPIRASSPPAARVRRDQTISYERPTVPEPLRPLNRAAGIESENHARGDTSRPLALAFPLETRRSTPRLGRFAWLARLFSPFTSFGAPPAD